MFEEMLAFIRSKAWPSPMGIMPEPQRAHKGAHPRTLIPLQRNAEPPLCSLPTTQLLQSHWNRGPCVLEQGMLHHKSLCF